MFNLAVRVARQLVKLLRGAKPGDLPLTMPEALPQRADEVTE